MDKHYIIEEIKRTAEQNGGQPLGVALFEKTTNIKRTDWYGKYWARWSDAAIEAGYEKREKNVAYDPDVVLKKFAILARELGKFPVTGEIRLQAQVNPDFPAHNTVDRYLGKRERRPAVVIDFCERHGGFDDVIQICRPLLVESPQETALSDEAEVGTGFVYLMKSGKYHKIGRTNSPDRRQYEIGLHLPEELIQVHSIETDDPSGIEAYWHNRFSEKRLRGEWFDLKPADVRIFRRRKFM